MENFILNHKKLTKNFDRDRNKILLDYSAIKKAMLEWQSISNIKNKNYRYHLNQWNSKLLM